MTAAAGCLQCGEDQRRIKRLVKGAAHAEWLGKPVADLRDEVSTLKAKIAACGARGHTTAESRNGAAARRRSLATDEAAS